MQAWALASCCSVPDRWVCTPSQAGRAATGLHSAAFCFTRQTDLVGWPFSAGPLVLHKTDRPCGWPSVQDPGAALRKLFSACLHPHGWGSSCQFWLRSWFRALFMVQGVGFCVMIFLRGLVSFAGAAAASPGLLQPAAFTIPECWLSEAVLSAFWTACRRDCAHARLFHNAPRREAREHRVCGGPIGRAAEGQAAAREDHRPRHGRALQPQAPN
jgi:hypothetical protein